MAVKIILHCSASPFGNAALIAKWHVKDRKWSGIGYHYVILNGWITSSIYHPGFNGHIETGRPLDNDPVVNNSEMGAHVRGHNHNSVGVCLIGNSGKFTDEQLNAALQLVYRLEDTYPSIQLMQHSDLDPHNKPYCAGLDMNVFKRNYQTFKDIKNDERNRRRR
ncbi:MAG: N-acetylmuramoyl-L-alanine amidase [Bacteroidales bacterium]|nr:N-acetylmuramoyl-L-alanine amidase [Bacteroidales bacterium]